MSLGGEEVGAALQASCTGTSNKLHVDRFVTQNEDMQDGCIGGAESLLRHGRGLVRRLEA